MYTSQTDGADGSLEDWYAFLAARKGEGEQGRIAADQFMRARVDAMALRQDSGLMESLDSVPRGKKRRAAVRVLQAEEAAVSSSVPGTARFDGDDDLKPGEEDPDDAINSDLDDPDDDLADGDNSDDDMVDYMLCTYDKVQRVKNKWKCTLKDGILTTNKKEYVFYKCSSSMLLTNKSDISSTKQMVNLSGNGVSRTNAYSLQLNSSSKHPKPPIPAHDAVDPSSAASTVYNTE